ncbi:MAG: sugar kinase [Candidatus Thermoplasmatota archaeon]
MYDVVAIGNLVVDFIQPSLSSIPSWESLIDAEEPTTLHVGGNAGIFSIIASRLGLKTAVVGAVGNDFLGSWLLEQIKKNNVNVKNIKKFGKTSTTVVLGHKNGERGFIHYEGANSELKKRDIDKKLLRKTRSLHLCGYFLMEKLYGKPSEDILKEAKKNGVLTTFDVAWDPKNRWTLDNILEFVDIFFPNFLEVKKIAGCSSIKEACEKLIEKGVGMVVVKIGKYGCYICSPEFHFHIPTFETNVLEGTGSGDAFDAAFVFGLLKKMEYKNLSKKELEKIALLANATASYTTTMIGCENFSGLKDVHDFIKNSKLSHIVYDEKGIG